MSLRKTLSQLSIAVGLLVSVSACDGVVISTPTYYDATPNGFVAAYDDLFGYSALSLLKVSSEQPGYFVVKTSAGNRYALNIDTLYYQYGNDMARAASDFHYVSGPYWGTWENIGDSTVVDFAYTDYYGTNWYEDYWGYFYSKEHKNHDVSQKISDSEKAQLAGQVAMIMDRYQMSEQGAFRLAKFAQATKDLVTNRQKRVTKEDQSSFERALMTTTNISATDLSAAVAKAVVKGDEAASQDLFEQASKNLGCKSSGCVSNQIAKELLGVK